MWRTSNILKQIWVIKISFMNKLWRDWTQGIHASILSRIFCLPVCCPKNIKSKNVLNCIFFGSRGCQIVLAHWARNINCGCSRTGRRRNIWVWERESKRRIEEITHGALWLIMVNIPHEIFFRWCNGKEWYGRVGAGVGEKGLSRRILIGKPEGKKPPGRRRRRWESTIQVELTEIGWDGTEKLLGSQEGLCSTGFINDVHVIWSTE